MHRCEQSGGQKTAHNDACITLHTVSLRMNPRGSKHVGETETNINLENRCISLICVV